MRGVNNFITKAQENQHAKAKEQQTRTFLELQAKAYNTPWAFVASNHKKDDTADSQDK